MFLKRMSEFSTRGTNRVTVDYIKTFMICLQTHCIYFSKGVVVKISIVLKSCLELKMHWKTAFFILSAFAKTNGFLVLSSLLETLLEYYGVC